MAPRVVTHAQVVEAATAHFLRHSRLDVEELSGEMAVSRSTLYRVIGTRDRLLGDVLDGLSARAFALALRAGPPTGEDDLLQAIGAYVSYVSTTAFREFLRLDRELAFRILFMPEAGVHVRQVERVRALLAHVIDVPTGADRLLDDIAFAVVRLAESMIYTDLLVGREPNTRMTMHLIKTLLAFPRLAALEPEGNDG